MDSDDLATARALITTLQDQVTTLQRENASLRHQLDVLCQRLFGKKSERVDPLAEVCVGTAARAAGAEGVPGDPVDRVLDEFHGPVAQADVDSAGVVAGRRDGSGRTAQFEALS